MYNLWIVVIVLAIIEIAVLVLHFMVQRREWYDVEDATSGALFLFTVLLTVVIILAITNPLDATKTVNSLLAERDALQNLFENREDLDKIYITQRVVEYNKEVARIIGKVKSLGNWSAYAFTDYELLTFIEI